MAAPLTKAAIWALAQSCSGLQGAAPLDYIARYVWEESAGNPDAWNDKNTDGSVDCGIGQINNTNWTWLSEKLHTPFNAQTCKDPCLSMAALGQWWRIESTLATGSETRGITLIPRGQSMPIVWHMSERRFRQLDAPGLSTTPPQSPKPTALVLHSGTARSIDFRR